MKSLVIEEGKNTPAINFDIENNKFSIFGRSFPENSKKFYEPILAWLNKVRLNDANLEVEFKLYYISSSSIISLLEIITKLDNINSGKTKVSVVWYYESDDEDIFKTGEDYQKVCSLDFNLVVND